MYAGKFTCCTYVEYAHSYLFVRKPNYSENGRERPRPGLRGFVKIYEIRGQDRNIVTRVAVVVQPARTVAARIT